MNKKEFQDISIKINQHYKKMDNINNRFSAKTGISCVSHCNGQCCKNNRVEINPVEFIPLVLELHNQNKLLDFYFQAKTKKEDHCLFFVNGRCSIYENRAVLCRLFGYSSVYNKQKEKAMSICALIKAEKNTDISKEDIELAANIVDFSSQIKSLLPEWDNNPMQINQAFIYATERFLNSVQYEEYGC